MTIGKLEVARIGESFRIYFQVEERSLFFASRMTTLRRFEATDLFKYANVNLDPLTETYHLSFYLQYLATWPDYFTVAESPSGNVMGYIMGKAEGQGKLWHGHVTAVTSL